MSSLSGETGARPGIDSWRPGLHRLAVAGAVCTLLLVFLGGSVTSNDAGMAFPDWPTVEGGNMFVYPPSKWVGDKFFEHTHRLLGATVGMVMIALAVMTQLRERRRWVRWFAWGLLAAVIVQGVMGGLRVTQISIAWAIVHGCFAQLFFSATVCMALFTSRVWMSRDGEDVSAGTSASLLRYCWATCLIVFGQLIAGALYRHLGEGLAYHIIGAVVVTFAISGLVLWVSGEYAEHGLLLRLIKWAGGLFVVQLALGVAAYVSTMNYDAARDATLLEWLLPSLHVAVGASILAVTIALTAAACRYRSPVSEQAGAPVEVRTA